MTRTNRFLFGVGWGYVNQLVMAAAGLFLTRFYLGSLGGPLYGLWIVGLQVLTYLTLLDLGIVALLPRETAYAAGADRKKIPKLLGETLSIALFQMPLLALLSVAAWFLLPADWAVLKGPLGVTFAVFALSFPLRVFPAVLQGLQDFSFLGQASFLTWFLATITSVAGLKAGIGLYALSAGWAVGQGVQFLACYLRLRLHFPADMPKHIPAPSWARAKARLSKSLWVTLSQISGVLLVGTELLVLGKLLGPAAVVIYSCSSKLVQLLANQPQTLTQAALPGLSELKSSRDLVAIRRVSEALTVLVMLLSGAIVAVVLAVNGGFVKWWVGEDQYGGDWLTISLVACMLVRHYGTALVFSLFCFGQEKPLALIGIADGLVTLGLSVLLTPRFGIAGPALGSLVSACLISIPCVAYYLARELNFAVPALLRPLAGWAWRLVVIVAASAAVLFQRPPEGPLGVAAIASAIAVAYGLLMLPVVKASALLLYVRPTLERFTRRRAK
jgi:O-antigen/teichoic acid export membrane protein